MSESSKKTIVKELESIEQIRRGNLIKGFYDLKDVSIESKIPSWVYYLGRFNFFYGVIHFYLL